MASYIEIWNLYNDATLKTRTAVACMKAAADVLNEDVGTTGHAARLKWAEAAFANPFQAAQEVMWSVVSNATIAANGEKNTQDSDIQFVVNSYVDILAKRYG